MLCSFNWKAMTFSLFVPHLPPLFCWRNLQLACTGAGGGGSSFKLFKNLSSSSSLTFSLSYFNNETKTPRGHPNFPGNMWWLRQDYPKFVVTPHYPLLSPSHSHQSPFPFPTTHSYYCWYVPVLFYCCCCWYFVGECILIVWLKAILIKFSESRSFSVMGFRPNL